MQKEITSRYAKDEEGKFMIDISISKYSELFDEWDSTASYVKKDIDSDLADYLYDCFEEINHDFVIRIKVPRKNSRKQNKVRQSLKRYFEYMAEKEMINLKKHMSTTSAHLIMGVAFILTSIIIGNSEIMRGIIKDVLTEGMTIIGWVTLWQVTAFILYEWKNIYKDIKIYRRIANTEINFS